MTKRRIAELLFVIFFLVNLTRVRLTNASEGGLDELARSQIVAAGKAFDYFKPKRACQPGDGR